MFLKISSLFLDHWENHTVFKNMYNKDKEKKSKKSVT